MRILVVTQYFWPETFRVNDLVGELVGRGHDVTVLTSTPNYPEGRVHPEFNADPTRFARFEGADVVRVPQVPRGSSAPQLVVNYASFVVSGSAWGPLRLRGREFDAIFVFQPSPIFSCLPALLLGRLKGTPVLLWVLDLWPDTLEALGVVRSPSLLRMIGKVVEFIYRRCALILVQSRAFVANVAKNGGAPERIRYFPGWSESLFSRPLEEVEPAPEVRDFRDGFNVMFAGNVGEAQDFPAILDAAEILRHRADIRWLIVGDGRMAEWVRTEIARRSLEGSVRLLGRHPLERMPAFFRAAGALLVSLKRDPVFAMTIPGKVQTYLASGLPVLGMLDGEGARVLEESQGGWVCPAGDARALAALVERMAALPEPERREMGRNGLAYSAREFDRAMLMSRLEGWMEEVLSDRPVEVAR